MSPAFMRGPTTRTACIIPRPTPNSSFVDRRRRGHRRAPQEELNPSTSTPSAAFPAVASASGARARSLQPATRDWRFIHVRRLMSMIEESVEKSMQWAVFEPNDEPLRRTLVHSLNVFLEAIWQRGRARRASSPTEGFFVKCDETNNPQAVVDAGPPDLPGRASRSAAPMEFIVFEIRQRRRADRRCWRQ